MIPLIQRPAEAPGPSQRACDWAVSLLAGSVFLLASCGYPGDVLPPALNIPTRVTDLKAVERGNKIEVTFTVPPLTTENLQLAKAVPDLRVGTPPETASAVPDWAPGLTPITVREQAPGPVMVPVDAAPYAGKTVVVVVRLAGGKGRWSEWSLPVQLNVITPLKTPAPVEAQAVAPTGIGLAWPASGVTGVTYRVSRQGPGDSDFKPVATVDTPKFIDATAQYDLAYQYTVQAFLDKAESEPARPVTITAVDKFAPAVPTGVTAVSGINTIELNWERNTDADFAEFRVYRLDESNNRARIAEKVLTPVFTDRQLASGKRYRYTVTAVDRKGNESGASNEAEAVAP